MVGEVEAESAPAPEEKIQPCPKDAAPVPPLLMAKVEVAWTTPAVAKRVPFCEPKPKVVVVAFVTFKLREFNHPVVVALVVMSEVWKAVVVVAFVPWIVVAKSDVEVACVVVLVTITKFVIVEVALLTRMGTEVVGASAPWASSHD